MKKILSVILAVILLVTATGISAYAISSSRLVSGNEDYLMVLDAYNIVVAADGMRLEDLSYVIQNDWFAVLDSQGNGISADRYVGTGMIMCVVTENGEILSTYGVVVPFDLDGNGRVTTADARTALRQALQLESVTDFSLLAGDANADLKITSFDARVILRAALGLSID